ncbi:MAG: mannose-1-phosphate guanylyltransferase [Candidatus Magasanikbacteria bacterium]|nr:mannose-1-phosphate guanylyltransferase [Candidatus Magasanikbacteria bacterium]
MNVVIRAGGSGSRLWPLSRQNNPKQFLPLISERTLLEETFDRVSHFASPESIAVTSNVNFSPRVRALIPDPRVQIIEEPQMRNTGPAIAFEVASLIDLWGAETIVATLPSDDAIVNVEAFAAMLRLAENYIKKNPDAIVTPAVLPRHVDVGFSYLEMGDRVSDGGEEALFTVKRWVEKPSQEFCEELVASGRYFAHTGMYVWRLGAIWNLFRELRPEMAMIVEQAVHAQRQNNFERARELFATLSPITIESAITHSAPDLIMSTSNAVGWSDIGKWSLVRKLLATSHSDVVTRGAVIHKDTTCSLIYAPEGKVVTAVGVDNLVIVDTPDALLVVPLDRVAEVKDIVEELKKRGMEQYL